MLSAGCAMLGCGPGFTGLTGLQLPIYPPQIHFSLFPTKQPSCSTLSSVTLASKGCVSNSGFVTCHYSFHCSEGDGNVGGYVGFSGDGEQVWTYNGDGSSSCEYDSTPLRSYGVNLGVPAMDIYGDTLIFDKGDVTLLQLGQVSWVKSIDPAGVCGDSLSGVSVSNSSRTMMSISTTAEVFGYYADGVPVAEVVLYANASSHRDTTGFEYIPPSTGKSIPISPQVSNGLRFVYIVRYYDCNTTSGEWRPELKPSSTLRIAAVDLHDDSIPRLQLPFQLDIPLADALQKCMPVSGGHFAGNETVLVAGPILRPDGLSILFALTCMQGDTLSKNNTAFLYAASIDGAKGDFPKVLWTSTFSLPSPNPLVSSSSIKNGGIPPLPFPILRSLIQDAVDSTIVWAVPLKCSFFAAIDQSSGEIVAQLDLVSMIQNTSVKLCPLAAAAASDNTDAHGQSQITIEFNGQPVASSSLPPSTADNSDVSGSTVLVVPVLSSNTNVQHWIVGLSLNARSTSKVLWCVLTPPGNTTALESAAGSSPVSGQIAPVVNKDGNVTLVFATELGLFGLV